MKMDKRKISEFLLKIEVIFFKILKYLAKGTVLLAKFFFIFFFLTALFSYVFEKYKSVKEIFSHILGVVSFGAFYILNMIPSTAFLCYKIDKLITKINYLNNKKEIKENFFLLFIKIILIIPILLLIFLDQMINFKISDFLRGVLKIKGINVPNVKLIISSFIFPLIYVFLTAYLAEKFLIGYYKKKSFKSNN
jgi:hypothetical protein